MTTYEIKCLQTWAWYTGQVIDYNPDKQLYLVTYIDPETGNNWKKSEWINGDSIRELPAKLDHWIPKKGEEIECKARAEENEPFGWWPCQIKALLPTKNGLKYLVAFDGWGDQHNDTFEKVFIRPRNRQYVY